MTKAKDNRLEKLEAELARLRREVDMFVPTETLDEYKNADEIKAQYQEATRDHSINN